jgi:hypothetical protein
MNSNKHHQINYIILVFIFLIIFISLFLKIYLLTALSILTGILYIPLFHSKNIKTNDERELTLRQQATDFTFSLFVPTLAISAFLFFFPSLSQLDVFSKGQFEYLESLGTIFTYLVLFLIIVYTIAYFVLINQTGGRRHEK